MPDMLEQFAKETIDELLKKLPAEERLKGLSVEELWAALPADKRAALAKRLKEIDLPPTFGSK